LGMAEEKADMVRESNTPLEEQEGSEVDKEEEQEESRSEVDGSEVDENEVDL